MSKPNPTCSTPWCEHADGSYVWQDCRDMFTVICGSCQVEGPYRETESDAIHAWDEANA